MRRGADSISKQPMVGNIQISSEQCGHKRNSVILALTQRYCALQHHESSHVNKAAAFTSAVSHSHGADKWMPEALLSFIKPLGASEGKIDPRK